LRADPAFIEAECCGRCGVQRQIKQLSDWRGSNSDRALRGRYGMSCEKQGSAEAGKYR